MCVINAASLGKRRRFLYVSCSMGVGAAFMMYRLPGYSCAQVSWLFVVMNTE
jgi:hypothetical protein